MRTIERHEVKCLHCGGTYFKFEGQDKCPHCGIKMPDLKPLTVKDIEITLNPLTGEVTAF